MKAKTKVQKVAWKSRAVVRSIEAGSSVDCAHCGDRVRFQAKVRQQQVICNVYVRGKWNRVEHFHFACYEEAGRPHGEAESHNNSRRADAIRAAEERARELTAGASAA